MAQRTREDKINQTAELKQRFDEADVLYLADFTGLNVKAMTELRRRFREAGTPFVVVKNRLALRALGELDLPDLTEHLRGPTGIVFATEDPVAPAKTLREFAKENDDRPSLKAGVVEQQLVTPDDIKQLASLPPRAELLAVIAGSLTAPVAGVAGVLAALLRDITYMVGEVARVNEAGDGS